MDYITDDKIETVFAKFPADVSEQLRRLRSLIRQVAEEIQVETLQESLKWGEPSFVSEKGTAIRLGWKPAFPDQYRVLFNCQTSLISTFNELYSDELVLEGNRAIVFSVGQKLPIETLKHCLSLALSYQQRKHLPMLGA